MNTQPTWIQNKTQEYTIPRANITDCTFDFEHTAGFPYYFVHWGFIYYLGLCCLLQIWSTEYRWETMFWSRNLILNVSFVLRCCWCIYTALNFCSNSEFLTCSSFWITSLQLDFIDNRHKTFFWIQIFPNNCFHENLLLKKTLIQKFISFYFSFNFTHISLYFTLLNHQIFVFTYSSIFQRLSEGI